MKKMLILLSLLTIVSLYLNAENSSDSTAPPPPILNFNTTPFSPEAQTSQDLNKVLNNVAPPRDAPSFPPQGEPQNTLPNPPTPPVPPPIGGPRRPDPLPNPTPGIPEPPPLSNRSREYGTTATYNANIIPEQAENVLSTAKRARINLKPGKVWKTRAPGGELQIQGGILYQGVVVSVVSFNPSTGCILPEGYKPIEYQQRVSLESLQHKLTDVVNNLQILNGVWYREPEGCWIVPLAYRGEIITNLKIYYDGEHIVPDYRASREMAYYGKN